MEFDEASFACVRTDDDSGEPVFCEEYLRKKVWLKDDGELFVEELRSKGGAGEVWSLPHIMQWWTESTLRLILGSNRQEVQMRIPIARWPRGNASTFVALNCVYMALGFVCFKAQWSKWAWHSAQRWGRYLQELGLYGHVIHTVLVKELPPRWDVIVRIVCDVRPVVGVVGQDRAP